MHRSQRLIGYVLAGGCVLAITAFAQAPRSGGAIVYDGPRLIIGDASPTIEGGTFVVQSGRITAIGKHGSITVPAGAQRVNLAGKTVTPAMNNIHLHIGYEGYTSWSVQNHTPANVVDHLQREAFYGVGTAMTMGDQPDDFAIAFKRDQTAGKFPMAARFFFAAGIAPPGGGPDSVLIKGTTPLNAVHEVKTPAEARAAVQHIAVNHIDQLKIWVDERDTRRGAMMRLSPEIVSAIVDEAHKHGITVHAHAVDLPNQKIVVKAGIDVLVHTIAGAKIDDEYAAILREKKPYWTPVMGLGDRPDVCDDDRNFVEQVLPAKTVADIREGRNDFNMPGCASRPGTDPRVAARREEILEYNFPKMIESGARIVLGTDAGVIPKYSFGWAEHHEIGMYVRLGLTPGQAIISATSRPTEVLKIMDTGTLATGKRADFVVLNANPLTDIKNTREIDSVYLNGVKVDREKLRARFNKTNATSP
jgi:imidazolonepropionase-like amidohydrolase